MNKIIIFFFIKKGNVNNWRRFSEEGQTWPFSLAVLKIELLR